MNRIIIDLETESRPEAEILHLAPEFTAPANYKDPAKIAEYIAERRASWAEKGALDALTGRIVAIGYVNAGGFVDDIKDERCMLDTLWATIRIAEASGWKIIGFNIARFDIPFAVRRSWALGIPVPPSLYKGRYLNPGIFIDLMEVWQMGNYDDRISLKRLAEYLGIGTKDESQSEHFGKLLLNNRAEAIKHLENDLRLTEAIADRLLGPQTQNRAPGIMREYEEGKSCE